MKKNPLSEIYESKILASEAVPSNKVKGEKELDSKIDAKKAKPVSGQGPDAVKNVKKPEEAEGTDVKAATPAVLKDSINIEAPKKSFEGSFEKLFKATINEQLPDEPVGEIEMDIEVPTSNEDMVDELEGDKDEVSDLVSDLKAVMDHLQNILDKISDETEGNEESSEEETEFGGEEDIEDVEVKEESTEEPVEEATELKPLGDKSKVLQNKNNKVGGSPKVHGGKAHGGDVESDPELKPAKSFDKSLQSPKGKPEVKSTVKKGEFFK
jgi:hypothetical protein